MHGLLSIGFQSMLIRSFWLRMTYRSKPTTVKVKQNVPSMNINIEDVPGGMCQT